MTFNTWLANKHPDIHLNQLQQAWIDAVERYKDSLWLGGRQTGKTYIFKLWQEYQKDSCPKN